MDGLRDAENPDQVRLMSMLSVLGGLIGGARPQPKQAANARRNQGISLKVVAPELDIKFLMTVDPCMTIKFLKSKITQFIQASYVRPGRLVKQNLSTFILGQLSRGYPLSSLAVCAITFEGFELNNPLVADEFLVEGSLVEVRVEFDERKFDVSQVETDQGFPDRGLTESLAKRTNENPKGSVTKLSSQSNQMFAATKKPGKYIQQPNDHKFPAAIGHFEANLQHGLFIASGDERENNSQLIEDYSDIASRPEKRLVECTRDKRARGRPRIRPLAQPRPPPTLNQNPGFEQQSDAAVEEREKPRPVAFQKKYFLPGSTLATTPKLKSLQESNPSVMQEENIEQEIGQPLQSGEEKSQATHAALGGEAPVDPSKVQEPVEVVQPQARVEDQVPTSNCSSQSKNKSNSNEKKKSKASVGPHLQPEIQVSVNNATSDAAKPTNINEKKPFRVNEILDKFTQKAGKKNPKAQNSPNPAKKQTQERKESEESSPERTQKKGATVPSPKLQTKKPQKPTSDSSESADEAEKLAAMNFASQILDNFDKKKKKEASSDDSEFEREKVKVSQKTFQSKLIKPQQEQNQLTASQSSQQNKVTITSKKPESRSSSEPEEKPAPLKVSGQKKAEAQQPSEAPQQKNASQENQSPAPPRPLKPTESKLPTKQTKAKKKGKKSGSIEQNLSDEELDILQSDSQKEVNNPRTASNLSDEQNSHMQLEKLPEAEEVQKEPAQAAEAPEQKKEKKPKKESNQAPTSSKMVEEKLPKKVETPRIGVIPRDRRRKKKYPNARRNEPEATKKESEKSSESESQSESSDEEVKVNKNPTASAHASQKEVNKGPSVQDMPQTKLLMSDFLGGLSSRRVVGRVKMSIFKGDYELDHHGDKIIRDSHIRKQSETSQSSVSGLPQTKNQTNTAPIPAKASGTPVSKLDAKTKPTSHGTQETQPNKNPSKQAPQKPQQPQKGSPEKSHVDQTETKSQTQTKQTAEPTAEKTKKKAKEDAAKPPVEPPKPFPLILPAPTTGSRTTSQMNLEPQTHASKEAKKPEATMQESPKPLSRVEAPSKKPKVEIDQKPAVFEEDKKKRKRSVESGSSIEKSPKIIKASKLKTRVVSKPEPEFTEDYIRQIADIVDNEENDQQVRAEEPHKKKAQKPKPSSNSQSADEKQQGKRTPAATKTQETGAKVVETPLKSAVSGGSQISRFIKEEKSPALQAPLVHAAIERKEEKAKILGKMKRVETSSSSSDSEDKQRIAAKTFSKSKPAHPVSSQTSNPPKGRKLSSSGSATPKKANEPKYKKFDKYDNIFEKNPLKY